MLIRALFHVSISGHIGHRIFGIFEAPFFCVRYVPEHPSFLSVTGQTRAPRAARMASKGPPFRAGWRKGGPLRGSQGRSILLRAGSGSAAGRLVREGKLLSLIARPNKKPQWLSSTGGRARSRGRRVKVGAAAEVHRREDLG
jgi:hypothetical protein